MYKGTYMRSLPDFSAKSLQYRVEWYDIFKVLGKKGENFQLRIPYLARLSLRIEGEGHQGGSVG